MKRKDCAFYHCEHQMGASIDCCTLEKELGKCPCSLSCEKYANKNYVFKLGIKELRKMNEDKHVDDLISRQAAIDAVNSLTYPSSLIDVKRKLVGLPSAQSERKKGQWIKHENPKNVFSIECSECGCWFLHEHLVRNSFCPNCGADMRDENDE